MTHFIGFVIGEAIDGQLARYDESREVLPYKARVTPQDLQWLWEDEDTPPTDLPLFVKNLNERFPDDKPYMVDSEGMYSISTYNPDSKWDWFSIGGRWPGYLVLRDGTRADSAPADKVSWTTTFAEYTPSVVVAEGVWRAAKEWGWFGASTETGIAADWDNWLRDFVNRLGDQVVTVVDFHI